MQKLCLLVLHCKMRFERQYFSYTTRNHIYHNTRQRTAPSYSRLVYNTGTKCYSAINSKLICPFICVMNVCMGFVYLWMYIFPKEIIDVWRTQKKIHRKNPHSLPKTKNNKYIGNTFGRWRQQGVFTFSKLVKGIF